MFGIFDVHVDEHTKNPAVEILVLPSHQRGERVARLRGLNLRQLVLDG